MSYSILLVSVPWDQLVAQIGHSSTAADDVGEKVGKSASLSGPQILYKIGLTLTLQGYLQELKIVYVNHSAYIVGAVYCKYYVIIEYILDILW